MFPPSISSALDRLGRPLRDLRISVTDRCNLRCTYCMPAEVYGDCYTFLPREALLSFEEIACVARAAVACGVEKVRITGGEPLLRKNLDRLVAQLRGIEGLRDLALTTNGLLLPQQAAALKAAGLDRVTISLDSLDDATAGRINGRGIGAGPVLEAIEAARGAGLAPIKINVVLQRGTNDGEIEAMAERFRGTGCTLRFIEYMDVGTRNNWRRGEVVPAREVRDRIAARWPMHPVSPAYRGEVAERYAYDDGAGEVGFIASVTQPFCGDCTRLRLSAEGALYTCLFAHAGADLRGPLREGENGAQIAARIAALWSARNDRYSEQRARQPARAPRVEMYHIGG